MDSNKKSSAVGEEISLKSDNGTELSFQGRLFSESSYFDEASSSLTRLRLFVADEGFLVYSIVSGAGQERMRRHYSIKVKEDLCLMNDGVNSINLPVEMLFTAVFGLCGIDPEMAEELRPAFEESLRAANI